MTESLFRKEAMSPKRAHALGSINIRSNRVNDLIVLTFVALGLLTVALLIFGEYTRRTRVSGQIVPDTGLVMITSPVSGVVSGADTHEGDTIEIGEVAAVVSIPNDALVTGGTVDELSRVIESKANASSARFAALRAKFDSEHAGLDERQTSLEQELRQVDVALQVRREQLRVARAALEKLELLREQKFVSELQYLQQSLSALEQEVAVSNLTRERTDIERLVAEVKQKRSVGPAVLAELEASQTIDDAQTRQEMVEIESRRQMIVRSPVEGLVAAVHLKSGQAVSAGESILTLLTADSVLQVHLMVPSKAIGFVHKGDEVRLRYRAFPHQKFGHYRGVVAEIARIASISASGSDAATDTMYRVVVTLPSASLLVAGKEEPLLPGMTVDADIMGESMQLWEWIVPRLSQSSPAPVAGVPNASAATTNAESE